MNNVSPLKLIVFDCDGTLVDSLARVTDALRAGWRAIGLEGPDAAAARQMIGLPLEQAVASLLAEKDHGRIDEICAAYRRQYDSARHDDNAEPLFEGILDILEWLKNSNAILGVATGKRRAGLDGVLEYHRLSNHFVTLQTGDTGPGKPHPAMLQRAMRETGAEPANTVMIGDTTYDMEMAKAAGATAIGITWGYHSREDLKKSGADEIFDTAQQLRSYLNNWIDTWPGN